jgi:hypothetical protein
MTDKEFAEYSQWMWADTVRSVVQALAIYGLLVGAYWLLVG